MLRFPLMPPLMLLFCLAIPSVNADDAIILRKTDRGSSISRTIPRRDFRKDNPIAFDTNQAEKLAREIDQWTTMTFAVLSGNRAIVEECVKSGADINAKDRFGRAPLLLAAEYNCGEMVKYLVNAGADVNTTDTLNQTPLNATIAMGDLGRTIFLLNHGANPAFFTARSERRRSPDQCALHIAAEQGSVPIVQLLIDKGTPVDISNHEGMTALHFAARAGRLAVAKLLLERGASAQKTYTGTGERSFGWLHQQWTPLHEAISQGHVEVVHLLLENGALANRQNKKQDPLLVTAFDASDRKSQRPIQIVRDLIKHGADVNEKGHDGFSALHFAAEYPDLDLVEEMIRLGANVNAADDRGITPLHCAVRTGDAKVVGLLLQSGANPNLESKYEGKTAMDIARENGYGVVESLLLRAGARNGKGKQRRPEKEAPKTEIIYASSRLSAPKSSTQKPLKHLSPYRIECDIIPFGTQTEQSRNTKNNFKRYYLVFEADPHRIPLEALESSEDRTGASSPEFSWLEEGRLLSVGWENEYSGTGHVVEFRCLLLLFDRAKITEIIRISQPLKHRMGPEGQHFVGISARWIADTQTLVISQGKEYLARGMPPSRLSVPGDIEFGTDNGYASSSLVKTKKSWRYKMEGRKLCYLGGEMYACGVNGRVSLDVAEEFGRNLSELKRMNASLRGRIYCDRDVLVDSEIPAYEEERP